MKESVRQAFTVAWQFYKKYADMPDTEEAWEHFSAEGQKIIDESANAPFTRELINAVLNDVERECEKKRKKNKKGVNL